MRAVSLFDYAGGFRIGADAAGLETVAKFEYGDLFGRRSADMVRRNLPTPEVVAADFIDWRLPASDIDVCYGNPPCGAFSTYGPLQRGSSPYMNIWRDFADAARRIKPRWTVMESIELTIRHEEGYAMMQELRDIVDPDAWLHHVVVDAHEVGSPQRRRRYFAVITREDYHPDWPQPELERSAVVKDVLAHVPDDNLDTAVRKIQWRRFEEWDRVGLNPHVEAGTLRKQYQRLWDMFVERGGDPYLFERPFITERLARNHGFIADGYSYYRLAADRPMNVLTKICTDILIHPDELRPVTLREAFMLMGFPPDWNLLPTDSAMYATNGVTSQAGRHALDGIGQTSGRAARLDRPAEAETWWWSPTRSSSSFLPE